jgi:plasmid maintenance system antidote protein VapI
LWLNLQRGVDLWKARRSVKIERIPTLEAHY